MSRTTEIGHYSVVVALRPTLGRGRKSCYLLAVSWLTLLAVSAPAGWAAGFTVVNSDRNKNIEIYDAITDGSVTTLLYATRPSVDQGHASQDCVVNLYLLELHPGLVDTQPQNLAENYCAFFGMSGTLLDNGDVRITAGARVETWRPGTGKLAAWRLTDVDALKGLWSEQIDGGTTPIHVGRNGDVVVGKIYNRQRKDTNTASGLVLGLSADGSTRWQVELQEPGVSLSIVDLWATADGGALLHIAAAPMAGASLPGTTAAAGALVYGQNRLYRVSAAGTLSEPVVITTARMPDFSAAAPPAATANDDPAAFQAAMQAALQSQTEASQGEAYGPGEIVAYPRTDGSVDLLIGRNSRTARLLRIGADGRPKLDAALDAAIAAEGLGNWIDFLATEDQVILFGTLSTRGNRLPQGYLSWIGVPQGDAVTRLAPLDPLGLQAAREAGDEEVQHLEHNPAHRPKLVTSLAGRPLMVSLVYRSRRSAIQLDEGTELLLVYTEARDERRSEADRQAQRQQRKAERDALQQAMNADMAAAIGVSPEAYAAMSNRERKEALARSGNLGAIMAAAQKQAAQAQQRSAPQGPANPQETIPGTTPELAAAMAEAQRAMAEAGISLPDMPVAQAATGKPDDAVVLLDANMHGHVSFEHRDHLSMSLIIFDRQTGAELLHKDYADGRIDEQIDFARFQLPLKRIGIVYRDASKQILGDLTPVLGE